MVVGKRIDTEEEPVQQLGYPFVLRLTGGVCEYSVPTRKRSWRQRTSVAMQA